MEHHISDESIERFAQELQEEEKCSGTVQKYLHDVRAFAREVGSAAAVTKELVVRYKQQLTARYAVSTVNGILASLNSFFKRSGWYDCVVKSLRTQREAFRSQEKELRKEEYFRLLSAAKSRGDRRLYCLMESIGCTGIRISELRFITVSAVQSRRAQVSLKGKSRTVLLPKVLCRKLKEYCQEAGIQSGSIFVTRNGRPMDRSNIFKAMKALCAQARVDSRKVFPHNLRHLFACTYYKAQKDIAHLADILGHSSVETTRIYLTTSCAEQERQIEQLGLVT